MSNSNQFELSKISDEFHNLSNHAIKLLCEQDSTYQTYAENIKEGLRQISDRNLLSVSFVGQYSAGKSTIISALTGDRDIKIDADIATDETSNFYWNGITLTDTPGLFTDRSDHDEITYEAIKKSDLLVYCITSDLFDDIILNNFIKLAYEQSYRNKMMLVVNKMSMEAGDYDELRGNYFETLSQSLVPYNVKEFPISFIDAADYIEGLEDDIEELIEISHFNEFLNQLNNFVEKKGILGKLDTPIRIAVSEIDKALLEAKHDQDSQQFFMILNRIEDRLKKSMRNCQFQIDKITSTLRSEIISIGNNLALMIGEENIDFEGKEKEAELKIQQLSEQASQRLEEELAIEREQLSKEIASVFESDLGRAYLQKIENQNITLANIEQIEMKDLSNIQKNFKTISLIAGKTSNHILKLSGGADMTDFLRASDVVGSKLHENIYNVGKFFGYKFKPWQAANMSKTLGNVMKTVGPILDIASIVLDVVGDIKQSEEQKKVLNAKNECSSAFVSIANDIKIQFQQQYNEYKNSYFNQILNEIADRRKDAINSQEQTSSFEKELIVVRGKMTELISKIQ